MGGAVKQLALVVAAVAVAPYASAYLIGAGGLAVTAGGFYAINALVVGGIIALGGKALGLGAAKTNMDDIEPISSYATTSLRNQTNNNNVVPTIYGENRLGGNRVFADVQTGGNTNLYEIIVFANHEVNDFVKMFANNEDMTQGTGADTDNWRFANDKILVKVYKVKSTPIKCITSYGVGTWNESDLSSLTFKNTTFLDTNIPDGVAFAVVHHIYNATDNNQRREITARIQGKLIRSIDSVTTIGSATYSNNPAEVVLDFLTDSKNFNESDIKLDIETFYNSKLLCNSYGFTTNITFGSKSNLSAAIQEILATMRGQLIYSQGLWKLKQDEANRSISFEITADDIVSGTFSWSQKKAKDLANKVRVNYIEPTDQWQTKQVEIEDSDLAVSDGREYIKDINLRGVTNQAQADKIKELSLNQFRYTENSSGDRIKVTPLVISFTTTIKNSELEVGDMGTVDYYELPNIKKFVIISIRTKQSGELEISATEYADTHYKDSGGSPIIS